MNKKLGVKTGDNVVVITGKDKGKSGKVLSAHPQDERVLVEGVNIVQRHRKARSAKQQSGIMSQPAPIHVSNVMIYCPTCKQGVRTTVKMSADDKKVRVCKKCGAEFDK